ncbi:MAG: hypothetical protein WKG07_02540 [Hymenobacter sp.]
MPDQPGNYTAKLVTKLVIPGQVTDATLAPDGRRLVLLARQELFILAGNSWEDILKATPATSASKARARRKAWLLKTPTRC